MKKLTKAVLEFDFTNQISDIILLGKNGAIRRIMLEEILDKKEVDK